MKKLSGVVIGFVLAATIVSCDLLKEEITFTGSTMGTTYQVKLVAGYFDKPKGLQQRIDQRLKRINQSMSTYLPDSEISRFNNLSTTEEEFAISDDFLQVMQMARRIYEMSDGAWDATVDPLVQLWGFGRGGNQPGIPDRNELQLQMKRVGFDFIRILDRGALVKKQPAVSLDLGSIAKGFGVDQIAALLKAEGHTDFLVEIGGEVYAAGHRIDGKPWRIGVNDPDKDAPATRVYRVTEVSGKAMATSGDYRNFVEIDGRLYSHVIDPRTGFPVDNGVVSVTLIAENCTLADGLATAVMVMGYEKGLALVESLPNVEGLIIVHEPDGTFTDHLSKGFPPDIFHTTPAK